MNNSALVFIYSMLNGINIPCKVYDIDIYRELCGLLKSLDKVTSIYEFMAIVSDNKSVIFHDVLKRDYEEYKRLNIKEQDFKDALLTLISLYKRRRLVDISNKVTADNVLRFGVDRYLKTLEEFILEVKELELAKSGLNIDIKDNIDKVVEEVEYKKNNPGIPGVTTGFKSIDKVTGGYQDGMLFYIGARPSHGKTTFMLNSAVRVAMQKIPVLVISRETTAEKLIKRILSMLSKVPMEKIEFGEALTDRDIEEIRKAAYFMKELPLYIDRNFSRDFYTILELINKAHKEYGVKVVFIDYIQIIASRGSDSVQEIGRISRELRLKAAELGITIVGLSQLNREVEKRDNKRPELSDLKNSGALEQDADVVALLYNRMIYDTNNSDGILEFIIKKNKDGRIATIELFMDPTIFNITEREDSHENTETKRL